MSQVLQGMKGPENKRGLDQQAGGYPARYGQVAQRRRSNQLFSRPLEPDGKTHKTNKAAIKTAILKTHTHNPMRRGAASKRKKCGLKATRRAPQFSKR